MKKRGPVAGWYQEPDNPSEVRYWDGEGWTDFAGPAAATIDDIMIYMGEPPVEYWEITKVKTQVDPSFFKEAPTADMVNVFLRENASRYNANAVIRVGYRRKVTFTSLKSLTASGTAVLLKEVPGATEKVPVESATQADSPVDELRKLGDLKKEGLLTEEEFAALKAKLLRS